MKRIAFIKILKKYLRIIETYQMNGDEFLEKNKENLIKELSKLF